MATPPEQMSPEGLLIFYLGETMEFSEISECYERLSKGSKQIYFAFLLQIQKVMPTFALRKIANQ